MSLLNEESLTRRGVTVDPSGAAVGDLIAVSQVANGTAFGRKFLPLTPANTIALLGDSITNQNSTQQTISTDLQKFENAIGYWTRAHALLGQRFTRLTPGGIENEFGGSGLTAAQMMSGGHVAAVLAAAPGWCVHQAGRNDVFVDAVDAATTLARIQANVQALIAAGIRVVVCTILPGGTGTTAGQHATVRDLNNLLCRWVPTVPGAVLCDWAGALIDPATGAGAVKYFYDGSTHPNIVGASRIGKVLADVLDAFTYNASELPIYTSGILAAKALQVGTGGTFSGSNPGGGSGAITAGCTVYVDTGTTLVASKVARSDVWPGEWQQLQVTAASTTGGYDMRLQTTAAAGTSWNVGDVVYAEVEFETDSAGWTARDLKASVFCLPSSPTQSVAGNAPTADLTGNNVADPLYQPGVARGVFRTPTMTVIAGTTSIAVNVRHGAGLGTVRWGRAQIYKV